MSTNPQILEFRCRVALPLERAFSYLSDPRHLDRLTPTWLRLKVVDPELPPLTLGSEIDYEFSWRGIKTAWRSRIIDWRAPERFTYEQVRGPYRQFRHDHLFFEAGNETLVIDRVSFIPPGGALVARLFVTPELERIFAFRANLLGLRFPTASPPPPGK